MTKAQRLEFELSEERRRYDSLLDKYHALAFGVPQKLQRPPAETEPAKREPSLIAQTIREQSGGDPRLAAHLRTYAGKLKREGADENQIAYALGQWQSTEPDIPVS